MKQSFRIALLLCISFAAIGADYRIELSQSTKSLKVKEQGKLIVDVQILPVVHLNQEAPIKLSLENIKGLQLAKNTFELKDAHKQDKQSLVFEVPFQAQEAGNHTLSGKIRFFLCGKEACQSIEDNIAFTVQVK